MTGLATLDIVTFWRRNKFILSLKTKGFAYILLQQLNSKNFLLELYRFKQRKQTPKSFSAQFELTWLLLTLTLLYLPLIFSHKWMVKSTRNMELLQIWRIYIFRCVNLMTNCFGLYLEYTLSVVVILPAALQKMGGVLKICEI